MIVSDIFHSGIHDVIVIVISTDMRFGSILEINLLSLPHYAYIVYVYSINPEFNQFSNFIW